MSSITISGSPLAGKKPASWSVTEAINEGWTANLRFGEWINLRSATSPFELSVTDDLGQTLTTPELLHNGPGRQHGKTRPTNVELVDAVSWMLSSGSESLPTQIGGTMADLIDAIASLWAVAIANEPDLPLYREDVKGSSGWAPLLRMARVAGQLLDVTTSNVLTFRDAMTWVGSAVDWKPHEGGVREIWRPLDRYDKIVVTKNLGIGTSQGPQYYDFTTPGNVSGELAFPLGPGATPSNEGGTGNVGWVSLWNGNPTSGGEQIATWPLTGDSGDEVTDPATGTWPATHFTAIVYPELDVELPTNCRLKIAGAPYDSLPAGIEGAINETYGSGRGLPATFSDSMIPDKAHADATHPAWLQEANRGTNGMEATGPLNVAVRCGRTFSWPPLGLAGRIEQATHSHDGRKGQTSILVNCDVAV